MLDLLEEPLDPPDALFECVDAVFESSSYVSSSASSIEDDLRCSSAPAAPSPWAKYTMATSCE